MSAKRERRTYRVRQLPSHVDRQSAAALLARLGHDLGPAENIQILSLAPSLNPWENPPTKTATLSFRRLPSALDNDRDEWLLPAQSELALQRDIIVDIHFLDFTPLNHPERHVFDCIAISGLASHPFGSWKQKGKGDTESMWLRDFLPRDLPIIRTIIYGYDTALLDSDSFQTVDDIAISFIVKLRSIGQSSRSAKPLIFLAHSLGGIVLKRALVMLANSGDAERYMFESIKQIILFGVPSQGMHMSHFLPMVRGYPNEALIMVLSPGSQYLFELDHQFNGIAHLADVRLISVYETKVSSTTERSSSGVWQRTGPKEILVKPESAIQRGSGQSDIFPVDKDHSDMVKYGPDDTNYRGVLSYLHQLCESSEHPKQSDMQFQKSIAKGFTILSRFFQRSQISGAEDMLKRSKRYPINRSLDLSDATEDVKFKKKSATDMMESLLLESDGWRVQEVQSAYKTTFDWIFEDPDLAFPEWLRSGTGVYWISGKPGSGKSTLMKHISQSPRTGAILDQKKQERLQITARFFFHDRGTRSQKSFEGLLHSVLYQILSQASDTQELVLPIYRERGPPPGTVWPAEDLELAFTRILRQDKRPIQVTLFLDALDEYDGSEEMMLKFITLIIQVPSNAATQIQACFSSRPWKFLNDKLERHKGFEIHKQTKSDIWTYVEGRFAEPSTIRGPETQDMFDMKLEIVDRAEGVFLWVKLIIDHLVNASERGAAPQELMQMISILPSDLQKLYERIVQRIPAPQRKEAFIMFEIVLRSNGRLAFFDFATTVNCASHLRIDGWIKGIESGECSDSALSDFNRRLKDRYGAFLEVIGFPYHPFVQFIHQTVKEFVSRPGFARTMQETSQPIIPDNGHTFLSKFYLAFLMSPNFDLLIRQASLKRKPIEIWNAFADHACDAETSTGVSQQDFLDSLEQNALHLLALRIDELEFLKDARSVRAFAVVANLILYVKDKTTQGMSVNSAEGIPLLHCAAKAAKQDFMPTGRSLRGESRNWEKMTEFLLENDADTTAKFQGRTAFAELFDIFGVHGEAGEAGDRRFHVYNIIKVFLSNGFNPDSEITIVSNDAVQLYSCKSLHIAPMDIIMLLLRYRANINATDVHGQTPLDIAVRGLSISGRAFGYVETSDRALLLMEKGGQTSPRENDAIPDRLKFLLSVQASAAEPKKATASSSRLSLPRQQPRRSRSHDLFRKSPKFAQ